RRRVRDAGRTNDPLSLGRVSGAGRRTEMRRIAWMLAAALSLAAADGPIELSLRRAIELAASPEGNTNVQLAVEAVKQAESRSAQARASLLPDLSGLAYVRNQV